MSLLASKQNSGLRLQVVDLQKLNAPNSHYFSALLCWRPRRNVLLSRDLTAKLADVGFTRAMRTTHHSVEGPIG